MQIRAFVAAPAPIRFPRTTEKRENPPGKVDSLVALRLMVGRGLGNGRTIFCVFFAAFLPFLRQSPAGNMRPRAESDSILVIMEIRFWGLCSHFGCMCVCVNGFPCYSVSFEASFQFGRIGYKKFMNLRVFRLLGGWSSQTWVNVKESFIRANETVDDLLFLSVGTSGDLARCVSLLVLVGGKFVCDVFFWEFSAERISRVDSMSPDGNVNANISRDANIICSRNTSKVTRALENE